MFLQVQALSKLREREPPLTYGRFYFREVSGNGTDFGHSFGSGGLIAFSRILADREVLIVANTGTQQFSGAVLVDRDINATPRQMTVAYSNLGNTGTGAVRQIPAAKFYRDSQVFVGPTAALDVELAAREVQILVPI